MKVTINQVKEYIITSDFGSVDSVHKTKHTGCDLAMPEHTDLLSPVDGIVARVFDYGSHNAGKGIVIRVEDGKELIFGHLSEIHVTKGQIIHAAQKIGESGNTGFSTAPHLHLGLKINGHFADPSHYVTMFQNVYVKHLHPYTASTDKSHIYNAVSEIIKSLSSY